MRTQITRNSRQPTRAQNMSSGASAHNRSTRNLASRSGGISFSSVGLPGASTSPLLSADAFLERTQAWRSLHRQDSFDGPASSHSSGPSSPRANSQNSSPWGSPMFAMDDLFSSDDANSNGLVSPLSSHHGFDGPPAQQAMQLPAIRRPAAGPVGLQIRMAPQDSDLDSDIGGNTDSGMESDDSDNEPRRGRSRTPSPVLYRTPFTPPLPHRQSGLRAALQVGIDSSSSEDEYSFLADAQGGATVTRSADS